MTTELERHRNFARTESERTDLRRPDVHSRECRKAKSQDLARHHCSRGPERCACECHDADRAAPPTERERELWKQIADEIDRHLAGDGSVQGSLL